MRASQPMGVDAEPLPAATSDSTRLMWRASSRASGQTASMALRTTRRAMATSHAARRAPSSATMVGELRRTSSRYVRDATWFM